MTVAMLAGLRTIERKAGKTNNARAERYFIAFWKLNFKMRMALERYGYVEVDWGASKLNITQKGWGALEGSRAAERSAVECGVIGSRATLEEMRGW